DEVNAVMSKAITQEMYATEYGKIFEGDRFWKTMPSPTGAMFKWDSKSTYVHEPPFFKDIAGARDVADIANARVLAVLGDSVTTVIAETFERIHRSNLVGMGILPLQYQPGQNAASLGLTGAETFTIRGLNKLAPRAIVDVEARRANGEVVRFRALARVDDPVDIDYMRSGGVLNFVFGELLAKN